MFYIDRRINFTRRDIAFMHVLPAIAVFILFLIISIWNWSDLRHAVIKEQSNSLDKYLNDTSHDLEKELGSYSDVTSSGAGLFEASDYVSHNEWGRFVNIFDLKQRYPGIRTVGFIKFIPPGQLHDYTGSVRSKENIRFSVYPDNARIHASIVYTAPSGFNNRAIGYDMYSDKTFRTAMEKARDSGEATLTSYLSGNKVFGGQPQVLIFSPIYAKNSAPKTQDQRKQDIWGYIFVDVLANDFMGKVGSDDNHNFAYTVKMSGPSGDNVVLYKSPGFSRINSSGGRLADNRIIKVNDLSLGIRGVASNEIVPKRERRRPTAALWFGVVLSALLGVFIYTLLSNRTKAFRGKESEELQTAKDELLALASHQLRTPATGVKQYVGMLREGYGGKMTAEQKEFLDRAYESNERQLNTINDMLFAARADNGEIKFTFKKVDILKLVRKILEEQKNDIKNSGLKLSRRFPRDPVYVRGDEAYLRMAIENIVNNSIKYTRSGGNITVKLKQTKNNARLSVDDTGVGVDEKYRDLLFRKFSRVPNELSNTVTGSGIGLYLAKKVTDAHKGRIYFKSSDGQGSNCTITLPLYKKG